MTKNNEKVWIVERSFDGKIYKPVWMECTRDAAREWLGWEEVDDGLSVKYRVRKYVPESKDW